MLRDFDPARMRMRVARRKPYVNDQNQSITPPQEATLVDLGASQRRCVLVSRLSPVLRSRETTPIDLFTDEYSLRICKLANRHGGPMWRCRTCQVRCEDGKRSRAGGAAFREE